VPIWDYVKGEPRLTLLLPASTLPACANAAVEANCHPSVVAGFGTITARAHAAAADARERMLVALLEDPSCFNVCEQNSPRWWSRVTHSL